MDKYIISIQMADNLNDLSNEELLGIVMERNLMDKFVRVQKCVLIKFLREESLLPHLRYTNAILQPMTVVELKTLYKNLRIKGAPSKLKKDGLIEAILASNPPRSSSPGPFRPTFPLPRPSSPKLPLSKERGKEPVSPVRSSSPVKSPVRFSKSPRLRELDHLKVLYKLKHSPSTLLREESNLLSSFGIHEREIAISEGRYKYTWFDMNKYDTLSPVEQLHYAGVTTLPLISGSDLAKYQRRFDETLETFPEYKRDPNNPRLDINGNPLVYVAGGFAALGNPASFHNPLSRELRKLGFRAIYKLMREFKDRLLLPNAQYKLQALSDRMMFRQKGQKPTAESWHRDVMPGDKIAYSDEIFGGWINLDSVDQYFSCIPGSHLDVVQKNLRSGFATLYESVERIYKNEGRVATEKEKMAAVRAVSQDKHVFRVPPGSCITFPQYLIHEVVAPVAKYDMRRQFTGWRLTSQENLLYPLSMFDEQAVIPLPGGMIPPIYSKSHLSYFQDKPFKLAKGVSYSLKEWSKATFKDECITKKGIVERHMNSLQAYGFDLYGEYTEDEKLILVGVKL